MPAARPERSSTSASASVSSASSIGSPPLGIRDRFPEEAAHRRRLGKFYHRPPGGESWADVILRLRSAMNTINLHYCDKRVLIVCHQVVVLCFRYILEELDEQAILAIDKQADVLNCGIAAYDFEPDAKGLCIPELTLWNHGAPSRQRARRRPRRRTPWRGRGEAGTPLDPGASTSHPLPPVVDGDKETKGRILVVAGSRDVPGAALLCATAAMRAGAGKLRDRHGRKRRAVSSACAMPEAMVVGLPEDEDGGFATGRGQADRRAGRKASMRSSRGPGMSNGEACATIADALLETSGRARARRRPAPRARTAATSRARKPPVLLPHAGELALTARLRRGGDRARSRRLRPPRGRALSLRRPGQRRRPAMWSLPTGEAWTYDGGAPGLGVSGSGDVLAGIVGGLLARGAEPLNALLWAVWLHGEAGATLAKKVGPIGFLAREIADENPALLPR